VTLCGAGALGSNLADNFARQGFKSLRVIDHDRIEEHNVGTQLYGQSEIGLWKVEALRNRLFQATGAEIEAVRKELTADNARALLKETDLIVDAFDNSLSRQIVQDQARRQNTACLHAGLSADYAEIVWDPHYKVPAQTPGNPCDHPLARNLILLTVAVASEAILAHVLAGEQKNWSITLRDFAVRTME
jgi:molybdopterin/thiamine biosynthesis adenylyltransferase